MQEVNIWWLPDELERIIYYNMMTLMLSVLDEVVDGMSINFAGVSDTILTSERRQTHSPPRVCAVPWMLAGRCSLDTACWCLPLWPFGKKRQLACSDRA